MKKITLIIAGLAIAAGTIFMACNKASNTEVQTTNPKATSTLSTLRVTTDDFIDAENTLEIINKYGDLYSDGDIIVLSIVGNKTRVTFTGNEPQPPVRNPGEPSYHKIESKSKLDFAKACDKELKNGGCLKVGYDKSTGTYWADSIPC